MPFDGKERDWREERPQRWYTVSRLFQRKKRRYAAVEVFVDDQWRWVFTVLADDMGTAYARASWVLREIWPWP